MGWSSLKCVRVCFETYTYYTTMSIVQHHTVKSEDLELYLYSSTLRKYYIEDFKQIVIIFVVIYNFKKSHTLNHICGLQCTRN